MIPGYKTILGLCGGLVLLAAAAQAQAQAQMTTAMWQADLDELTTALKTEHPRVFHKASAEDFQQAVDALEAELPQLDDKATVVELARLVAMIKDGHTRLAIPRRHPDLALSLAHSQDPAVNFDALHFSSLPVRFDWFDDGVFITAANQAHADLIGARVDKVGSLAITDVLEQLSAVGYGDNEQTLKLMAMDRLTLPEVLTGLGIVDDPAEVSFSLTRPESDSDSFQHIFTPLQSDGDSNFITADGVYEPLWLKHRQDITSFELLPDQSAIYVQINEFEMFPDRPIGDFIAETMQAAYSTGANRYILDLRHNHGGSGSWTSAVTRSLMQSRFNQYGSSYILLGRNTFSASQKLVNALEQYANVIFVGEGPGSSPSSYGDPKKIQLTNSGLTLRISTLYWHSWLGGEFRENTSVHLDVPYTSQDYFSAQDPVLEQALSYTPPAGITAQVDELLRKDKIQAALILFLKYLNDPEVYPHDVVAEVVAAGHQLLDDGLIWPGYVMMVLARDFYPKAAIAHIGQGRAYELRDEIDNAVDRYRHALELEPDNIAARQALARLE